MKLTPLEIRILGTLMEKAITTPEHYPLTLNSLVLGCNQKTSRDPLTQYDDDEVLYGLDQLRDKGLAVRVDVAGSRVPKFRHKLTDKWELDSPTYALLCILLLRGPQTLGQLRQRSERIYAFSSLDEVESTLEAMNQRAVEPTELVQQLPRLPGTKEMRYGHTLGETPDPQAEPAEASADADPKPSSVIGQLEQRIEALETKLQAMEERFEAFRKEFE